MKQNLKYPPAAGQAATVKPGRADSDFDAAKRTLIGYVIIVKQ